MQDKSNIYWERLKKELPNLPLYIPVTYQDSTEVILPNYDENISFPMMSDIGFEKEGFCVSHHWNNDHSKCLRCGLEMECKQDGDIFSCSMSMTIPMKVPGKKNNKNAK